MDNIIAVKTLKAFSINCGEWIHQGSKVNIKTKEGNEYNNRIVRNIFDDGPDVQILLINDSEVLEIFAKDIDYIKLIA